MFNKFFSFSLTTLFLMLISFSSPAQTDSVVIYEDDFESYTAGVQVACQDTIHRFWDTWNSIPCDPVEDPYVTNSEAHSGVNSVWIQQGNDLVSSIPNYTYGKYSISFYMYIPTDYTASWGQLAAYYSPDSTEWGFYVRFDTAGTANINAGGWWSAVFPFEYNTWIHNELIVDLSKDSAEYYFEGSLIHSWQWTLGSDSTGCPKQLSITDIWGGIFPNTGPTQYYMDDYVIERLDTTVGIKDFSVPTDFILDQNYPNPFNPATKIKYQIPELSFVTINVYDVLGREVTILINEEKTIGNYEVEFNAAALSSGVYFYQLKAGDFVETKKMVLLR